MKNQLNKILKITFIILFFTLSKSYAIEDVSEFTDAITKAREKFDDVSEAATEQSKIIDEAIKEIDKATEYVQDAINSDNAEDAIKTLNFIEKTLLDVGNIIPQEFSSDMSSIDITSIEKEDMDLINELTAQMGVAKEEKENEFMSDLMDLNLKGIDTVSISENLNGMGVDTIKLVLNIDGTENFETWTKQQWAESYTGSIVTSAGNEAIPDKEISSKITELEDKLQENTFKIDNKRIELVNLNTQIDPLNTELQNLNEKKAMLTSQYNLELTKLGTENLSELETQNTIELSEKLKNQIETISNEVLQTKQKSNSLNAEILSLNNTINDQILASNKLRDDIENLSQNKLELSDAIALRTAKLNELRGQSSELSSNQDVAELTARLDQSDKLKTQLTDLQSQIKSKNSIVSEKLTEVNSLNSQLDPLSNQIKSLQQKREALQNKYNSEVSNIVSSYDNNELVKSQELAAYYNNEINSVSSEIKSVEASSKQIQSEVSVLSSQINAEKNTINQISIALSNSKKELNRTSDIIGSKELELDRLINSDLSQTNQKLNEQLSQVSLQKDFIQSQFEKSIDKEVEAVQRYVTALGDIDSEYFDQEVDFTIREVGVILDGDPRKAAAFDIEKYATYAGLSKDFIQQGIDAVNNDDWDAQKKVFKDITKALAKNSNWAVDMPSDAELNVLIAEEKALHQAIEIVKKGDEIKKQVDSIINERTKPYQELSRLNQTNLQYAVLMEGSSEKKFFDQKYNELIDKSYVQSLQQQISNKNIEMKQIQTEAQEIGQKMLTEASVIQREAQNFKIESFDLQQQKNEWLASINEADQTVYGGIALLQRGRGTDEWKENFLKSSDFDDQIAEANASYMKKQTEFIQKAYNNNPMYKYNPKVGQLGGDIYSLQTELNGIEREASQTARSELINAVDEAKENIQKITNEEIAKNPDYNYVEEVNKILDNIPSIDSAQRQRANEALTGIDHTSLITKWYPVNVGDKTAALRAALGDKNDYEAYKAAVKAMSEMGKAPVSEFMTGPYWEMTNVKAAAIVRSKKYDYVDDYAYMNAYYEDPLQLNTSDRQYVESELKGLLGNNNPKLNALNIQVNALKSEIDNNNAQLVNINENISKLENEISSIKSSEEDLKNQISKLNNDLTSKQSIIDGKNKSLNDLQKNLDPINNKITELETKRNDLNNNIQDQINLISQNTKKSEEITQKTSELENKLSKELSEIDQQINGYKKDTEKLNVNISSLNNEIINLEKEKPDISNKILKINDELIGFSNVKAELNVLTAEQKSEIENIDIEINKLESELTNFKTSESQINQQLANLTNELKSKENVIKNNNLSISEIQKQIDPLNSQINTLENQKISLNDKFNKDLANLSKQIEQTTETKSVEVDKLKADFESQISKLNEEINNFETQANDLNSTVSALNNEIKSIEVETPEISNQIISLNQDLENFTDIKADMAMATAKKLGINVDEKTLKSVNLVEGKVIITIQGTNLVSVVDKNKLIDDANKFIDPTTELSVNSKVYTAKALNKELVTPDFINAAKSISVSQKIEVIAQSSAIETVGATTEQSKAFATAKAARLAARKDWDEAMASGDKVAAQAAEDAFMAAKKMEQASIKQAAAAVAESSVASQAAQVAQAAAQDASAAAQDVAQVASAAAQEAASEVKETVQAAAKSAQEAALDALWAMESMPGSSGMHTLEVTAAIRQLQAEMNGNEFNYLGAKSYEEAMQKIAEAEAAGKNQIQLENELGNHDKNRMGKCGKASC